MYVKELIIIYQGTGQQRKRGMKIQAKVKLHNGAKQF